MEKVVYILGAGFSKSANAPLQSEIIKEIFSIKRKDLSSFPYNNLFFKYRRTLIDLLVKVFYLDKEEFKKFPLEDIFSAIDRSLLDNISLGKFDKIQLLDSRDKINALIIMLMDYKLRDSTKPHIKKFADYLVNTRKINYDLDNESDPYSIISTNWDIILENALFESIHSPQHHFNGKIDYCFYIHSYDENEFPEKLRSGLYWRGKGYFNVKILKLHGSMNWLQCQKCQRVFVTFFRKIALDRFISKPTCKYCEKHLGRKEGAELLSVLIMPTFLKDLSIFQLKLSWQITGIELQEASKIVFMGYSFPLADFEFRQLLARSVKECAEIDVVLCHNDEPIKFPGTHRINEFLPEHRYKSFFGKRKINFFYEGVEKYINSNF